MQPEDNRPPDVPQPPSPSDVDQKIFEEYSRTHPIGLEGGFWDNVFYKLSNAWQYHRGASIAAVSCLALVLIVMPIVFISTHGSTNSNQIGSVTSSSDGSSSGGDAETSADDSDTASSEDIEDDPEATDEGTTSTEPDEGFIQNEDEANSDSPADQFGADASEILDEAVYNDPSVVDDESSDPEPMEPGPVEEPPVPQDPPTTPPPSKPDTPTGQSNTVDIASLNYAHGRPVSGIDDAVKQLSKLADIVGFQEFGPASHRSALQKVVHSCGSCGYALYMPDIQHGGNIPIIWKKDKFTLVSKGNVKVYDSQRVEDGAGGPIATAKHIIWVRLKDKKSGRIFTVMNEHLVPTVEVGGHPIGSNPKRLKLYQKHITMIANKAQQFKANGQPTFAVGDFNVNFRLDKEVQSAMFPYVKMGKVGMWASWRWIGTPDGGTINSGNRVIDYVFVSRGTRATPVDRQILGHYGSDHRAILTKIDL